MFWCVVEVGTDFNKIVLNVAGMDLPGISALPPINLIINSESCSDLCGSSLHQIWRILEMFPGVPVIDTPDAVLQTSRDENALEQFPVTATIFCVWSGIQTR